MIKRSFPLILILLLATSNSACRSQSTLSGHAPDFTLDSLDGGAVTLSDLEGQVVVLDFWAIWCSPCVDAMPHLQQLHEQYAGQEVVVLAINVSERRDEVAEFMAQHGYTFTVLLDSDGRVTDTYGVRGIPYTIIVDRDGDVHPVFGGIDDVEDMLSRLVGE